MNRLFGSKSKVPQPTLDDAIASTDGRIASLDVRLSKINNELSAFQSRLVKMKDGPSKTTVKQRALKLLQQRNQLESQKDQLLSQSFNLSQTSQISDNLSNTLITVNALKTSNKAMKKSLGKVDIDKLEQIQDEMIDLIEKSNEIQETISASYNPIDDISELELDAELDALADDVPWESELDGVPSYLDEGESLPTFIDEEREQEPLKTT